MEAAAAMPVPVPVQAAVPVQAVPVQVAVPVQADGALPIKNAALSLGFDGGLLATVLNIASVVKAQIVQELAAYVNGVGGAYILIETQEATLARVRKELEAKQAQYDSLLRAMEDFPPARM